MSDGRSELQLKGALKREKVINGFQRKIDCHLLKGGVVSIPTDDGQSDIAGQLQEILACYGFPGDKVMAIIVDLVHKY